MSREDANFFNENMGGPEDRPRQTPMSKLAVGLWRDVALGKLQAYRSRVTVTDHKGRSKVVEAEIFCPVHQPSKK